MICLIGLLFCQLVDVELTLVLTLIQKVVRDLYGVVGVVYSLFVLVDLTKKSTDLHVSFAFVFQHF